MKPGRRERGPASPLALPTRGAPPRGVRGDAPADRAGGADPARLGRAGPLTSNQTRPRAPGSPWATQCRNRLTSPHRMALGTRGGSGADNLARRTCTRTSQWTSPTTLRSRPLEPRSMSFQKGDSTYPASSRTRFQPLSSRSVSNTFPASSAQWLSVCRPAWTTWRFRAFFHALRTRVYG